MSRRIFGVLLLLAISGCMEGSERGWDIPTAPQEKAAYDYAHRLKLPDSVPQPVPFNFWKARLKALWPWNPNVSEQYFDHLCKTEAGEYIFKTVENVEGVFQMRPSSVRFQSGLDLERYRMEAPIMMQAVDYDNWGSHGNFHSGRYFVQPMMGQYLFLEQPKPENTNKIVRLVRRVSDDPPAAYRNGYPTGELIDGNPSNFRVPFMVVLEEGTSRHTRYGFTWRGIKRDRDREHGIGGGEYLTVDLETNEVLGVKRSFVRSGYYEGSPTRVLWSSARPCDGDLWAYQQPVEKVLKPIPGINDQYIPEQYKQAMGGNAK